MKVEIKELGLAAYIKICGGQLVSFENDHFSFESEMGLNEWRVKYMNSCCYKHDMELMNLRKFKK
jgi:hypothetical protein